MHSWHSFILYGLYTIKIKCQIVYVLLNLAFFPFYIIIWYFLDVFTQMDFNALKKELANVPFRGNRVNFLAFVA